MTNNDDQAHRATAPASIRNEDFPRRMRGLDADKVYEYLDLLADQVQAADASARAMSGPRTSGSRAELRREVALRSWPSSRGSVGDRVNDQVVELFSQAQLVAEEMVEDVSRDARERLGQARAQERQILEEAMATAEQTRRDAEALIRWTSPGGGGGRPPSPNAVARSSGRQRLRSTSRRPPPSSSRSDPSRARPRRRCSRSSSRSPPRSSVTARCPARPATPRRTSTGRPCSTRGRSTRRAATAGITWGSA